MPLHLLSTSSTGARVRLLLASSALALLSACGTAPSQPVAPQATPASTAPSAAPTTAPRATADSPAPLDDAPPAPILGQRADSHGCKPSTGHAWCERTQSCERPWELALKRGFENTPDGWHAYCDGSTR